MYQMPGVDHGPFADLWQRCSGMGRIIRVAMEPLERRE
jgi:hypothetical protein